MRTKEIAVYSYYELSDSAKENARNWFLSTSDVNWNEESRNSIEEFCNHFGIRLTTWRVSAFESPDYHADYFNSHFRGLKLKDFRRDYTPTGYCLDSDLWETFYDVFKTTGSAKNAFDSALWAGFTAWRKDLEYQCSEEYVSEILTVNEYEFTEDGRIA